jgi:hypothetical protein
LARSTGASTPYPGFIDDHVVEVDLGGDIVALPVLKHLGLRLLEGTQPCRPASRLLGREARRATGSRIVGSVRPGRVDRDGVPTAALIFAHDVGIRRYAE